VSENEKVLIEKIKSGNTSAFKRIFEKYQQKVFFIAFRLTGNKDDAKDIVQDVFVRLFKFINKFDTDRNFYTWLYKLTVNASYDYLKKNRKYKEESIDGNAKINSEILIESIDDEKRIDLKSKLYELLEHLATQQRAAYIMREIDDLSYSEIAEILKCEESTVRAHVHLARKLLRKLIKENYPEILEEL
jgi:RNA polymerase sigma-70 factor (ECF subfamily)